MQTVILTKKDIMELPPLFLMGNVIALPTETVMGLGVIASSIDAYNKLIEVKNRPENKAFPLVVGSKSMMHSYGVINARQQKIVDAFMPGPLTIIVKKQSNVLDYVTANSDKIAIRYPDDEFIKQVVETLNEPILLTSANLSGEPSLLNSDEVEKVFYGKIRAIVKGEATSKIASTIVDISGDKPILIRSGTISIEEINKVWEE